MRYLELILTWIVTILSFGLFVKFIMYLEFGPKIILIFTRFWNDPVAYAVNYFVFLYILIMIKYVNKNFYRG